MPLCWKAFSENTTPHQQHWAVSIQVSPSNHLSVIGQHHPYAADVKMSFVQITQRKVNGRGENSNKSMGYIVWQSVYYYKLIVPTFMPYQFFVLHVFLCGIYNFIIET